MIDDRLPQWTEWSRQDDWHLRFVGSDIREMLAEIKRLHSEREQSQAHKEAEIARLQEMIAEIDRQHAAELVTEYERCQELLEQHTKMSNEAAGEAVAAERERCARVAFAIIEKRDDRLAWEVRAAIRKGVSLTQRLERIENGLRKPTSVSSGFSIGDPVTKKSGYRWPGEVRMIGTTRANLVRIVVECTVPEVEGALHIFAPEQLKLLKKEE